MLAQQSARASTTVSAGRLTTGIDPWEVLTPEEKVDTLRQLIHTELRHLVPEVLAGR